MNRPRCQVLAVAGGFQLAEKEVDVLSRIDFIVPATLDDGVHEGVVRRRAHTAKGADSLPLRRNGSLGSK